MLPPNKQLFEDPKSEYGRVQKEELQKSGAINYDALAIHLNNFSAGY